MKLGGVLLWTFVFTVCAQSDNIENIQITPLIGESKIKEIVEGITGRLCYGVPSMGIPKLEPFEHLDPIDVKLNDTMAELSGSISNLHLAGISGLELIDASFTASTKFSFEIKIPKVKASGKFKLKGSLAGLFPIDGDGSFDISVTGIKLTASGRLVTIDKELQLGELQAQPSIDKLQGEILNLVPNKDVNDFINKVLKEIGPQLLQDMWEEKGDGILRQIEQLTKPLVSNINPWDLIQIINGRKPAFQPEDPPKADCPPVIIP